MLRPVNRCIGGQNHELFAARTRNDIIRAGIRAQQLAHFSNDPIAHEVTVGIVDQLEQIEIDGQGWWPGGIAAAAGPGWGWSAAWLPRC
jgi:hypothetical protein